MRNRTLKKTLRQILFKPQVLKIYDMALQQDGEIVGKTADYIHRVSDDFWVTLFIIDTRWGKYAKAVTVYLEKDVRVHMKYDSGWVTGRADEEKMLTECIDYIENNWGVTTFTKRGKEVVSALNPFIKWLYS